MCSVLRLAQSAVASKFMPALRSSCRTDFSVHAEQRDISERAKAYSVASDGGAHYVDLVLRIEEQIEDGAQTSGVVAEELEALLAVRER